MSTRTFFFLLMRALYPAAPKLDSGSGVSFSEMNVHVSPGAFTMPGRVPALLLGLILTANPVAAAEINRPVGDVRLAGVEGKNSTLHAHKGKAAVVAVFLSFECPVSNSYVPLLNELARTYQAKNVAFLALAPTQEEAATL